MFATDQLNHGGTKDTESFVPFLCLGVGIWGLGDADLVDLRWWIAYYGWERGIRAWQAIRKNLSAKPSTMRRVEDGDSRRQAASPTYLGCIARATIEPVVYVRYIPLPVTRKTTRGSFDERSIIVRIEDIDVSTYEFVIVLHEPRELTEDLAERLFVAGCDDASPGQFGGECVIDFAREAEDLESAIRSAAHDVRAADCQIKCVRLDGAMIGEGA